MSISIKFRSVLPSKFSEINPKKISKGVGGGGGGGEEKGSRAGSAFEMILSLHNQCKKNFEDFRFLSTLIISNREPTNNVKNFFIFPRNKSFAEPRMNYGNMIFKRCVSDLEIS